MSVKPVTRLQLSILVMSLGDSLCMSRKVGRGEVRLVYPKGENSMVIFGLAMKSPWLELGGPFLLPK